MMRARTAIVLTDPQMALSSEASINEAVTCRLLPQMYQRVLHNPDGLPRAGFRWDLWSIFPWRCLPPVGWREMTSAAQARIAIDAVDQMPGHDVVMTVHRTDPQNPTVDATLQFWNAQWGDELILPRWRYGWRKPHIPFIYPEVPPPAVPADHPRRHVIWAVQHWPDRREEHAAAVEALPILKQLGVEIVFLARWDRGGVPIDDLNVAGMMFRPMDVPTQAAEYNALFASQFAYLVSVPSVGGLSVEQALAWGIPIVGAPTHRWSEWFSDPAQLAAYRADPTLYGRAAEMHRHLFGEATALAHMELAREIAQHVRGQSDA